MNITDISKNSLRTTGQVKWFNVKSGYGFITADGKDIFVHYSSIISSTSYKYLLLGEYIEFELTNSVNENHVYQANDITGLNGGKLMCESRHKTKNTNEDKINQDDNFNEVRSKRSLKIKKTV
jgi:CspA family cold shock protein